MKKIIMVLLITSMVLGTLTGCSNVKGQIEKLSKAKDEIKENVEEVSQLKDNIKDIIDIDLTDADQLTDQITDQLTEQTTNSEDADGLTGDDVWGKIAKYKVDNIIEEKPNSEIYMLVYISKEETANLVDYFDELLKETEDYNCEKVSEKETIINGYLRGTIDGYSIIVAVAYDNVNDENRVEFTSYKK